MVNLSNVRVPWLIAASKLIEGVLLETYVTSCYVTFLSNVQFLKDSETAFQGPYERHRER